MKIKITLKTYPMGEEPEIEYENCESFGCDDEFKQVYILEYHKDDLITYNVNELLKVVIDFD